MTAPEARRDRPFDRAEIERFTTGPGCLRRDRGRVAVLEECPGRSVVKLERILSVRELLDQLAGIAETVLIYPSTGGPEFVKVFEASGCLGG